LKVEIGFMKCTELIIQDHAIIRRGLDVLDGMVKQMEEGVRIELADVTAILKFLRLCGDEHYQTIEESVLFPALLRTAPDDSRLHRMLSEHAEERTLVAGIEDAMKAKKGMDFVRSSRRLSLLLRNHFEEEDTVLCDLAEQSLSKEEDNAVVAEFKKRQIRPEIHGTLSRLESRYTPQPHGNALS
jgi:hemerythrin-like domain-containing protein